MPSALPHPALDASNNLIPALQAFWPTYRHFFPTFASFVDYRNHVAFYCQADSLHSAVAICGFFTVYVYVMQEITGNASQVDGLWTFLPVIYGAHFALQKYVAHLLAPSKLEGLFGSRSTIFDFVEPRLALMFGLQLLWSARLTYNAIRRGMFKAGEEDYRWPLLRARMSKPVWEIFTLTFIATAQNILLACTALPQYFILQSANAKYRSNPVPRPASTLVAGDWAIAGLLVLNLTIQFMADHQQQVYQNFKRGNNIHGKPLTATEARNSPHTPSDAKRGFVTRGLWAWSRHPNFACEQTTWWILWLFVPLTFLPDASHWAGGVHLYEYVINAAIASPLLMNALFLPSTLFSEGVSAEKYPEYAAYQRRVGMFWPLPDTLARSVYYNVLASKTSKQRVEQDVWGSPVPPAKKST